MFCLLTSHQSQIIDFHKGCNMTLLKHSCFFYKYNFRIQNIFSNAPTDKTHNKNKCAFCRVSVGFSPNELSKYCCYPRHETVNIDTSGSHMVSMECRMNWLLTPLTKFRKSRTFHYDYDPGYLLQLLAVQMMWWKMLIQFSHEILKCYQFQAEQHTLYIPVRSD